MKHLITHLLIFALIFTITSNKIDIIAEIIKQTQNNRSQIILPALSQYNYQQEIQQYEKTHSQTIFNQFTANPQLSSHLLLKKFGRWSQSLLFKGKEESMLMMQISVIHLGDDHNHNKEGVNVFLINRQTNEIVISEKVGYIKLYAVEIDSEVYQLLISCDWQSSISQNNQSNITEEDFSKHIAINIDIDPIQAPKEGKADEQVTTQSLQVIREETSRIFLQSLQIWSEIEDRHDDFLKNEEQMYYRGYLQLLLLVVINLIEILFLKRLLKVNIIY